MQWWTGGGAFALSSSEGVRVNFRGVHLLHAPLRPLPDWARAACNQSAHALCCSDLGCVLPAAAPRISEAGIAGEALAQWTAGGNRACADAQGKVLVSAEVYDISACDILDEGLDVLYTGGEVYLRHTALPPWRYWTCVALAILLVRGLSFNVQALWAPAPDKRDKNHQWPCLLAALALIALVVPFDGGDSVYVTLADQTFFWATVGYVAAHLALHWRRPGQQSKHGWGDNTPGRAPVFNVIVASLQLFAMRLYTSTETPYDIVFVTMLAWRAWTKVLTPRLHGLSLVLDSLYLSLCIALACNENLETLVGVMGVGFVAARLMLHD